MTREFELQDIVIGEGSFGAGSHANDLLSLDTISGCSVGWLHGHSPPSRSSELLGVEVF